MEKRGAKKRPAGRPKTGARPVIAMRVHPDLYEDLRKSAARRNLSISEDAEHRLKQSFDWDRAHGDVKKLMADAQRAIAGGKESALQQWGLTPVGGRPGHWVEVDKIKPDEMVALNPALETLIERVVLRTLEEKAKQS